MLCYENDYVDFDYWNDRRFVKSYRRSIIRSLFSSRSSERDFQHDVDNIALERS